MSEWEEFTYKGMKCKTWKDEYGWCSAVVLPGYFRDCILQETEREAVLFCRVAVLEHLLTDAKARRLHS
jgi:hypothetical protein